MSNWTQTPRTPISFDAPRPSREAHQLLIADTYLLDIGGGFNLNITPGTTTTVFTTQTRSQGQSEWPQIPIQLTDQFLNIGGGFSLLIDNTHKLIIDPARSETNWTKVSRTPIRY